MQILITIILCIWLLACGSEFPPGETSAPPESNEVSTKAEFLPGSYIVALKPASYQSQKSLYFTSFTSEYRHYNAQFAGLLAAPGIKHFQHIGTADLKGTAALDYEAEVDVPQTLQLELAEKHKQEPETAVIMRIDFDDEETAQNLLKKWEITDQIWYAEKNEISQLFGAFADYATQYETKARSEAKAIHDQIKLREAFLAIDSSQANPGRPIIAILDSGVDRGHPAFRDNAGAGQSRVWKNADANVGQAGCSNDTYGCNTTVSFKDSLGNGKVFPTGLNSFNTECTGSLDKVSNCQHGTHVAGIAVGDVETGTLGICPVCIVMPIRIVGTIPGTTKIGILDSSILAGLKYISRFKTTAGSAGIRVVNASFGKFTRSKSVAVFIDLIHDELGAIIIAAAGNEDTNRMSYPASLSKVIAVSAVDLSNKKTVFSNFGSWVDVAAPGKSIYSSVPGVVELDDKDGTSMAAPVVAGLAGLMVSHNPSISPVEIRQWLLDSANPDIYQGQPAYDPKIVGNPVRIPLLGRGIINADSAIRHVKNPAQVSTVEDYNRVEDFCGTIHYAKGQGYLIWLVLLMPVVFAVFNFRLSGSNAAKKHLEKT